MKVIITNKAYMRRFLLLHTASNVPINAGATLTIPNVDPKSVRYYKSLEKSNYDVQVINDTVIEREPEKIVTPPVIPPIELPKEDVKVTNPEFLDDNPSTNLEDKESISDETPADNTEITNTTPTDDTRVLTEAEIVEKLKSYSAETLKAMLSKCGINTSASRIDTLVNKLLDNNTDQQLTILINEVDAHA